MSASHGAPETKRKATFRVWRGDRETGATKDYETEIQPGMVVLDAIHGIQAEQANDLAVRWNCKAGKCGSCSAEVNGSPKLMCMTRLNDLPLDEPVTVESAGSVDMRVMHRRRGLPLISALHEPHLPALQFHRTARSGATVDCMR